MADMYVRVPLLLIRLSGIPVCMQAVPKHSLLYNTISTVCFYCTYLSIIFDFVFTKDDVDEYMKNIRMLFGMSVLLWMHSYLRYFLLTSVHVNLTKEIEKRA
jgi:hypothetical protein